MSRNCEFDSHFIGVKMTMNCDHDSILGVVLPVENRILPIVHPIEIDKNTPLFYTFCLKHSSCILASGKNGSAPPIYYTRFSYLRIAQVYPNYFYYDAQK